MHVRCHTTESFNSISLNKLLPTVKSVTVRSARVHVSRLAALTMDSLLEFGTQVFRELGNSSAASDNLVFSPFSLTCALFLILLGADGDTRKQLTSRLLRTDDNLNKTIDVLEASVAAISRRNDTTFSSFLFVDSAFPITHQFSDQATAFFDAELHTLDFEAEPEIAVLDINQRVENATRGAIKKVVDFVSPTSKLVLLNALHFKSEWKHKFDRRRTKKRDFHLDDGRVVATEMMYVTANLQMGFSGALGCVALKLPYNNSKYSFVILLPLETTLVADLIGKLSFAALSELLEKQMARNKVKAWIPKLKVDSSLSLVPTLRNLEINDLFDPQRANLTGISESSSGLYVSDVLHNVAFECDEAGARGAAATSAIFKQRSLSFAEEFVVDRPFVYLVGEFQNQRLTNILFMGKFARP